MIIDCILLHRTNSLDMENFKAELSVPGGTKVQFELHYQEVLQRKLGTYEHVLYLQPGRLAKHFEVRNTEYPPGKKIFKQFINSK